MSDFAVSTTFKAHDRISSVFGKIGKSSDKWAGKATRNFDKVSRSAGRTGSVIKGILAASAVQRGLGLLRQGASAVTSEFIGFDQAVTSASAKFKDLNLATAEGQAKLQELRKTARQVGADTQFSAGQAASGLDFLAMAGFNAEQAMASLPGVVDLATVANVDLARSTDIASDSLGAFGLMTKDATQLQKNFTRVNDVMALTMSRTNTSMEDLFESIKKGAPTFTSTGQSLETFSALAGVMANAGVKGAESGTQLRNVMLRLAKPVKESRKVLSKLGITTKDQAGNFLDVVDILAQFEKGLKGMGTQQRAAALSTVFGARAVTGVNLLLQEGSEKLRAFRTELEGSAGASKKMATIMRQSLQNRLAALSSAAIELGFKFITAFEKQAGGAITKLTQFVRDFDPSPVISAIKSVASASMTLFNILQPFAPLIPFIVGGFVAYGVALKGLAMAAAIAQFAQLIIGAHALGGAMGVLNIIMTANPLGALIVGITAAIALFVFLEKKFGVLTFAWKSLKTWFDIIIGTFKSLGVGKLANFVGDAFANISTDLNEDSGRRAAPNASQVEAQQQQVGFEGTLNIAGAPEGSSFKDSSGGNAPGLNVNMLGANP